MKAKLLKENPCFLTTQETDYSCGAKALEYCYSLLGYTIEEEQIIDEMGFLGRHVLPRVGTLPVMIKRVSSLFDFNTTTFKSKYYEDEDLGGFLRGMLDEDAAVMLLVESGHWVAVVGYTKKYFLISDPAGKGLDSWTEDDLAEIAWNYLPGNPKGTYLAISVWEDYEEEECEDEDEDEDEDEEYEYEYEYD